eukprot:m.85041 g.85041  ORF g.85041 m.85041 type:complete len:73 (-) comp8727_c0_seq1:799-1017(-)
MLGKVTAATIAVETTVDAVAWTACDFVVDDGNYLLYHDMRYAHWSIHGSWHVSFHIQLTLQRHDFSTRFIQS